MKTNQGAQGHEGAFSGHVPQRGTGAFTYIGNAPCDAPNAPKEGHAQKADPLAHPRAVKIPLDFEQSEILLEAGNLFVVVARQTYPGNPARLELLCLPVPLEVARAAEAVALGKARAVKIKSPTLTEPKQ